MPIDDLPSSRLKEFLQPLLEKHRYKVAIALAAVFLFGLGVFFFKHTGGKEDNGKVEILNASSQGEVKSATTSSVQKLVVEVSGEVQKPGVYHFETGARIADALEEAGGTTDDADDIWMSKFLNRAARLTDGQKLYIPRKAEESLKTADNQNTTLTAKDLTTEPTREVSRTINSTPSNGLVNINTASLKELDSLPGIGQVYGQNIIDHRPYSEISELQSRGVLKKSTYDKIKDKITVS